MRRRADRDALVVLNLLIKGETKWKMICGCKVARFGTDETALLQCFQFMKELAALYVQGQVETKNLYIKKDEMLAARFAHALAETATSSTVAKVVEATATAPAAAPTRRTRATAKCSDPEKTAAVSLKRPAAAKQPKKKPAAVEIPEESSEAEGDLAHHEPAPSTPPSKSARGTSHSRVSTASASTRIAAPPLPAPAYDDWFGIGVV